LKKITEINRNNANLKVGILLGAVVTVLISWLSLNLLHLQVFSNLCFLFLGFRKRRGKDKG
jgi:hypothetical protein